jgi:hypothetical protein
MGLPFHRGPVGEPGGGSFAGIFLSEKKKYNWVPFMDPEDIKILSLGAIWNLEKEQGSPELILDYGAQRGRL